MSMKKKPKVVFIYGPIAVGKFTVGEILSKKLGYKFTHNHLVNDFVDSIFKRGDRMRGKMIATFRWELYLAGIKAGYNLIITHCYAHNYVSENGISDPAYVKNVGEKFTKAGADVCFVHLKANNDALIKRVNSESRNKYKKLTSKTEMQKLSKEKDWQTSAPIKNQLVIDNTKISAPKTANMIIKHFKLK